MIIFFIDLLLFIPFPLNDFSTLFFKLSIAILAFCFIDSPIGLPLYASLAILLTVLTASLPKADAAPVKRGVALFFYIGIIHLKNLLNIPPIPYPL